MINYLTIFRCYPSTIQVCRSARSFSSLHQSVPRVILRDFGNSGPKKLNHVISRRFHLTNFRSNSKNAADKSEKVKLRTSDIKRLFSLAKPEKWKIAGKKF